MLAFATDRFALPLPSQHRFPASKYRLLRARVEAELGRRITVREAERVSIDDLIRVHARDYVEKVLHGQLSAAEQREIGLPWSEQLVERSLRSAGATLAASKAALEGEWIAANLAGGTHHAYAHKGSGFCVFNDAAIAIRALQAEGKIEHAAIIDLDVHQGNGTASIFRDDPNVFTLSIHGEKNFPFRKEECTLDIALPDGTADAAYLAALEDALSQLWQDFSPELVIYLAGADPYEHDRLGRLKLTQEGLVQRDRLVLRHAFERGIPIALTMAGGYGERIEDTVQIQFNTIALAQQFHEQYPQRSHAFTTTERANA